MTGFILFLAFLGIGADGLLYTAGASPGHSGNDSRSDSLRSGVRLVVSARRRPRGPASRRTPAPSTSRIRASACSTTSSRRWRSLRVLPKPAVFIVPDPDPNAFATGSGPEKSSIAVTAGLLETLNREELQGVVVTRDVARPQLRRPGDDDRRGPRRIGPADLGLGPAGARTGAEARAGTTTGRAVPARSGSSSSRSGFCRSSWRRSSRRSSRCRSPASASTSRTPPAPS